MASRKLARDFFLSKHLIRQQLLVSQQISGRWSTQPLVSPNGYLFTREFGVFNEFSKKIKGEVDSVVAIGICGGNVIFGLMQRNVILGLFWNQDFQQSIKGIKEKAEELKGVKEDLKASHFHWEL
ncbi:hypothetical protein OROHE_019146 [Orobanche hederae]